MDKRMPVVYCGVQGRGYKKMKNINLPNWKEWRV